MFRKFGRTVGSAAKQAWGWSDIWIFAFDNTWEMGGLARVLAPWCWPFPGFYLLSRNQMPAKTRTLIDFLVERQKHLAADSRKAIPPGSRKISKTGESS